MTANMKVTINASKKKIAVSDEDLVWNNGACYMIKTQKTRSDWGYEAYYNPVISMTNVKKWLKKGALVQIDDTQYYRFNIKKLDEIINGGVKWWKY